MERYEKIPDASDWEGYARDLDLKHLHGLFFGKSNQEVQQYFGDIQSIERMDALLFAPRPVFQYYVQGFAMFVMSEAAAGDSESASPFLSLLAAREKRDPGSVREVYPLIAEAVDFVATHQAHFDADIDIYGDFKERAKGVYQLCHRERP